MVVMVVMVVMMVVMMVMTTVRLRAVLSRGSSPLAAVRYGQCATGAGDQSDRGEHGRRMCPQAVSGPRLAPRQNPPFEPIKLGRLGRRTVRPQHPGYRIGIVGRLVLILTVHTT